MCDEESLHHIHLESGQRRTTAQQSHSNNTTPVPDVARTIISIPAAPSSSNLRLPLPLSAQDGQKKTTNQPPRLLHSILHRLPLHIRFGINGFLSNLLFMVAYNSAVVQYDGLAPPSTIYAIVYLIFIPITHAMLSLIVFGWPEKYFPSLMSNTPIGLTAIALGAALTAYLDKVGFNILCVDFIAKQKGALGYGDSTPSPLQEKGEFYSSLVVLFITGMWTFVLSVLINAPTETSAKKEL